MAGSRTLAPLLTLLLLLPAAGVLADGTAAGPSPADPWWETTRLDGDDDGLDDDLEAQVESVPGDEVVTVLVDYAEHPTAEERAALRDRGAFIVYTVQAIPTLVVDAEARDVPSLATAPGVVLVEKDRALEPALDESRPMVQGVRAVEELGVDGEGVGIAIFDTGIDTNHPDLGEKVLATFDATRQRTVVDDLLGTGRNDPVNPGDQEGHGTHVAGIAAGPGYDSGRTYVGLAPGAHLLNVKVFDAQGDSSTQYVLRGIDWALNNRGRYDIRILQMSLGGAPTDGTDATSRAIGAASESGLLTVAAAGNTGPDAETIRLPGVAPRAITVGAVNMDAQVAEFSSRGPTIDGRRKPDVVAPGVDITSTMPPAVNGGSNYGELSGTSMAAPHVAGVAALVLQANASLDPARLKWILTATVTQVGENPGQWDPAYGWGLLNAFAAVQAAENPAILGEPPFREVAQKVPIDEGPSPLQGLQFEAEKTGRFLVPGATALAVTLALTVAAFVAGRWD